MLQQIFVKDCYSNNLKLQEYLVSGQALISMLSIDILQCKHCHFPYKIW